MGNELSQREIFQLAYQTPGLKLTTCDHCRRSTLWVQSPQQASAPRTCGRLACGKAMGEPWAKEEAKPER